MVAIRWKGSPRLSVLQIEQVRPGGISKFSSSAPVSPAVESLAGITRTGGGVFVGVEDVTESLTGLLVMAPAILVTISS